jgi:tRNA A37 threonylcarbamoyladenosine dehydratase
MSNDPESLQVDPNRVELPATPGGPIGDDEYSRRFGGVSRIYGSDGLSRLEAGRVAVLGVGGVGSWVVEALARSALGSLTLIDLDHVGESNLNRQIQALGGTLGQAKVEALAERIADINPRCRVTCIEEFVDADNVKSLLPAGAFDYVVDAMDDKRAKVAVAVHARAIGLPLIVVGSAGGQRDATRVQLSDLSRTEHDPLLARVRKQLRTDHGFSRNLKTKFGITAVFSDEPVTQTEGSDGAGGLSCAGYGSSVVVTAVFGFVAAGAVLNALARPDALAPVTPRSPVSPSVPASLK